jgi:hypothetical protein
MDVKINKFELTYLHNKYYRISTVVHTQQVITSNRIR